VAIAAPADAKEAEMEEEAILETLAESEHFAVLKAESPGGETTYHLEMGQVTLNFLPEEWEEFVAIVREAAQKG
jgi:hypothetical protein